MAQQTSGGGQARARGIDLNSASEEELAGVKQIGTERARTIVENRPFDDWDDLKELPGFTDRLVQDLQSLGFTIEPEE